MAKEAQRQAGEKHPQRAPARAFPLERRKPQPPKSRVLHKETTTAASPKGDRKHDQTQPCCAQASVPIHSFPPRRRHHHPAALLLARKTRAKEFRVAFTRYNKRRYQRGCLLAPLLPPPSGDARALGPRLFVAEGHPPSRAVPPATPTARAHPRRGPPGVLDGSAGKSPRASPPAQQERPARRRLVAAALLTSPPFSLPPEGTPLSASQPTLPSPLHFSRSRLLGPPTAICGRLAAGWLAR